MHRSPLPAINWYETLSRSSQTISGGINLSSSNVNKGYRYGSLPDSAPLAMAYVPMQDSVEPGYDAGDALMRGTLFPGLDLPFMGIMNKELPPTPMAEMMAIDFVVDELELYLDTHAEDEEAYARYQRKRVVYAQQELADLRKALNR